jgi:hypothetical protein
MAIFKLIYRKKLTIDDLKNKIIVFTISLLKKKFEKQEFAIILGRNVCRQDQPDHVLVKSHRQRVPPHQQSRTHGHPGVRRCLLHGPSRKLYLPGNLTSLN